MPPRPRPRREPAAQPPIAIPAEELAKLPKDVAAALKERKILVLGVFADGATEWRPMADDDRYVRNALRKTNRYDGDVVVKQVAVSKLSTYGSLVNDLDVNQSPSSRRHRPRPQGPRPDRLRRPHRDQPGDRRRASTTAIDPGHRRRLPA